MNLPPVVSQVAPSASASPLFPAAVELLQRQIAKVILSYWRSVQEGQTAALSQSQEVNATYLKALQALQEDINQRSREAYRTFVEELGAAWEAGDLRQASQDAYVKFVGALQPDDAGKLAERAADAQRTYMKAVENALTQQNPEQRSRDAADVYVKQLTELWTEAANHPAVGDYLNDYLKLIAELQKSGYRRTQEAVERFSRSLTELWNDSKVHERGGAALQEYLQGNRGMLEACQQAQARAADDAASELRNLWSNPSAAS